MFEMLLRRKSLLSDLTSKGLCAYNAINAWVTSARFKKTAKKYLKTFPIGPAQMFSCVHAR
ncbi:hypothetical protein Dalk_0001 [Desulfatibacillum aliphaticivorans]|uniref:Uncharacterized protein n=1 Tax=Desulfatibacillum aliphaticivorans TaxID=218208 RepID=B8FFL7_DESAL|nr:hypothetical protein Dalk_0001 [Desulfatibacillum aliphaticivorans]